ncbi:MAG: hypothetical protein JXA03_14705 [Bacteroidales bacterium]|nr:hypothetical protein [Bacteroidales bacterium]
MISKHYKHSPVIALFLGVLFIAGSYTLICPSCGPAGYSAPVFPDKDYAREWHTADSLIQEGLPQSALKIVTMIYSDAKNEGNSPQFIKAILYRIKLQSQSAENYLAEAIHDLRTEISEAEPPAKQALHSVLAEIYWRYYTANRFRFHERSTLVPAQAGDDPGTWDLKTLVYHVVRHYRLSVQDAGMLKVTDLKLYDVILEVKKDSKRYRPTLYDFLAHRAADFFMNEEPAIIYPAEKFELDNEDYFSGTEKFSSLNISGKDSLSNKFHALQLLQELAAFHAKDDDPAALIDVELKRLDFVHRHFISGSKDSLYMNALIALEKAHTGQPSSTLVGYAIASELERSGRMYNPADEATLKYRFRIKEALEKCDEVISRFPGSDGADNCSVLKELALKPMLEMTLENANCPGKAFPALVQYRNLSGLHCRIIGMDYGEYYENTREYGNDADFLEMIRGIRALEEWRVTFPETNDFQTHSTECRVPGLAPGFYILLASAGEDFGQGKSLTVYAPFWISGISYVDRKDNEQGYHYYLFDRESGAPLSGAKVKISYRQFDYNERKQVLVPGELYNSDEKGYFFIPALRGSETKPNSFNLDIQYKKDRLVTDDHFYRSGYYKPDIRKEVKTWFFTDRAIYRPGQTVYFKGIVLEKYGESHEIKSGYASEVLFTDVNNREISRVKVTSNEYGSFSGSFTAPQGVLTGMMNIKNETGYISIRVEEYKRPTFEVVIGQPEGSYKLGQTVEVRGTARSFSGFGIDKASVTYRVVRETRFPWYDRGRASYFYPSKQTEITNGEVQTGEEGDFRISFTAYPDHAVPALYRPFFSFHIIAEVTDINGETQPSESFVNVGYNALTLDAGVKEIMDVDEFRWFTVISANLNGEKTAAEGTAVITLLKEPERLFRRKEWHSPDVFLMTEEEYRSEFPNDMYTNEGAVENLEPAKVVYNSPFNTATDSLITLENQDFTPGRYSLRLTAEDEYGEEVTVVRYFTLFSKKDSRPPVKETFWFHAPVNKALPGDTVRFYAATAENELNLIYEVTKAGIILRKEIISIHNGVKMFEIPVDESMRGGFTVHLVGVKYNRAVEKSFNVEVPFSDKEISFVFNTFRDRLEPGQKEEWRITLKGENGEALAAEMLASMYDASLDAFVLNLWNFSLYRQIYGSTWWETSGAFGLSSGRAIQAYDSFSGSMKVIQYDRLNWFGLYHYGGYGHRDLFLSKESEAPEAFPGRVDDAPDANVAMITDKVEVPPEAPVSPHPEKKKGGEIQIRRDFRETAFFFPALKTDENGNTLISFTLPESLTRWKLMGLAHSKDLKYGQFVKEITAQKELMVVPNPARFFREGDEMNFSAKVVNLSEKPLSGTVTLEFYDLRTGELLDILTEPDRSSQVFDAAKGESHACRWGIIIPSGVDAMKYRIRATSEYFSDGEEKIIPVLKNRVLVTESMPMPLKGGETRTFHLEKLKTSGSSGTLVNHRLTLEFSSNPSWYAVQALPYLMEGKYESADYLFNRYFANSLAQHIISSVPRIREVFEAWKNFTPDALLSQLEKNQELKAMMLEETPWVGDASGETEQKQRIALLFDNNRMSEELNSVIQKLRNTQKPGGGWPWFEGMPESRNITQNIVAGFGKLHNLGVYSMKEDPETAVMIKKAIGFLDLQIREDYRKLKEIKDFRPEENHLGELHIQYLYARSFFSAQVPVPANSKEAFDYFRGQAVTYWTGSNKYLQGMMALSLKRFGDEATPAKIVASLKEHALYSDEMGMYWRSDAGYRWYEAPVETHALLMEVFEEVAGDNESVEKMKIWLLKQKQTQHWKSNRATAEAVYALLLRGEDWLQYTDLAEITIGSRQVNPFEMDDSRVEAGTGYFKTSWSGREITPDMGKVKMVSKSKSIAWGALYWQYFENPDKITPADSPLSLTKTLFVERNTKDGPVIEKITDDRKLKTGDKIVVRIELRTDRDLEYVHMKDMRAPAFEPVNALSGYRYRSGLGYYESIKDASAHFFFDYLPKGVYVFEYPMVASQSGNFSNGITSVQCMYAPEFRSHSEGVRVEISEQ